MELRCSRLSPALGAQVDGVDLRALDDETFAGIADALLEHNVLFFRDQHLDDDEHLAFAARFGELSVFPIARMLGADVRLSRIEDTEDSPPDADGWHTDVTWIPSPPKVAVLAALLVPPVGGDTIWASLHHAYDAVSPPLRAALEPLRVRHHFGDEFAARVGRSLGHELVEKLRAAYPPVEHPLVRAHPDTGRPLLFLAGAFMQAIVDLHEPESELLLGHLRSLVDDPNGQVRWRWAPGDVAVWDERCTNHRALSDHYPQHRVMRRCTVEA